MLCLLIISVGFILLCLPICDSMQALESGELAQGGVVTEGSAGSTAISLATVAPAYGCKCHVVIPDDAAIEKVYIECIFNEQSSLTSYIHLLLLQRSRFHLYY